ncbi:MAG TPA: monovalent cation/H(+) antiporter subunit G [Devosiaceae bacterium]|jgi:multicomponent Na+:H+ antiporter subunit G|nr:monovalent cation/H(+) antiporter subunit G [Devosiaceae bacterium]
MTVVDIVQYAAGVLLLAGAAFGALAGFGMLRLPDLYTRMHAASKAGAVGAGFVLLAVALASFDGAVALRALLGILFVLLTTPLAAHLLARAAFHAGVMPSPNTNLSEMPEVPPSTTGSL